MDYFKVTARGIKREASGLLGNNWSRALATLCISLFTIAFFVQMNQLITSLIRAVQGDSIGGTSTFDGLAESAMYYYNYYTTVNGIPLDLLVSLILVAFYIFIVSPLRVGVIYWYQNLVQCENLQVGHIFFYYRSNERYVEALKLEIIRLLLKLGCGLLAFAPAGVCFGFAIGGRVNDGAESALFLPLIIGGAVLFLAGIVVFALLTLRYFFAQYLFAGDYGYSAVDCMRYSRIHMKGHTGNVFLVILSFSGWFLSCLTLFPIAFVIPYFKAAMAACAQDIIDEHMGSTLDKLNVKPVVKPSYK